MAKTINARMLKRHGACTPQYKLFLKYYGSTRSVEVTEEEDMKHAHDSDWNQSAIKFLNNNQYRLYNEAMKEPRKLHHDAMEEARKVCEEAIAEPCKLYNDAMEEPRKVCEEAMEEPQKVYEEAQARAFVKAYNS